MFWSSLSKLFFFFFACLCHCSHIYKVTFTCLIIFINTTCSKIQSFLFTDIHLNCGMMIFPQHTFRALLDKFVYNAGNIWQTLYSQNLIIRQPTLVPDDHHSYSIFFFSYSILASRITAVALPFLQFLS